MLVDLHEHDTLRIGEHGFTEADFAAVVRFNDGAGRRYFSVGHRSITIGNHVGYLEVGKLAIQILPKAGRGRREKGAWRDGLLDMLRVATGLRLFTPGPASQAVGRSPLLELIGGRFVDEVERLLHEGLARGYRAFEENGPAFRGRLLLVKHLRENLVRTDRFYVQHHTYDADILVNRILRLALDELATRALSPSLATRVAACAALFPEIPAADHTANLFDRVQLTRRTARYGDSLLLARLILEHRAPQLRGGKSHVFAILFDMQALWERYVSWLFRRAATHATVVTQENHPFWRVAGRPTRLVRPDLVVRTMTTTTVADAKWKVPSGGPSMDDLRQMFVYNELLGAERSLLVYPSDGDDVMSSGEFVVERKHRCETLHLQLFDEKGWCPRAMEAQVAQRLAAG